jgi:hypothetical protein
MEMVFLMDGKSITVSIPPMVAMEMPTQMVMV